jgi:hypothetical protein
LATADTPRELTVPIAIVSDVARSGYDKVAYTVFTCHVGPLVTRAVTHATRFEDLNHFLDTQLANLGIAQARPGCTRATIILGDFILACELPTAQ